MPAVEGLLLSQATPKKIILVLNKIDLVPAEVVREVWPCLLYCVRTAVSIVRRCTQPSIVCSCFPDVTVAYRPASGVPYGGIQGEHTEPGSWACVCASAVAAVVCPVDHWPQPAFVPLPDCLAARCLCVLSLQPQKRNISAPTTGRVGKALKEGHAVTGSGAAGTDGLMQLIKNYSRNHKVKASITVGVIGYPNVGKSSVINSLKRSKAAVVSPVPGSTKNIQVRVG